MMRIWSLAHKQKENQKRNLKPFWRKDGTDFIAKLGNLDKAIVVTYYTPKFPFNYNSYYAIGTRSFLPFTDEQHKTKFDNYIDCCEFAESIVMEWLQSLLINPEQVEKINYNETKIIK